MDKFADSLPINARITVDYTKPNNNVKFEYPVNDRNIKKWVLTFIFPVICLVWMFVVGVIYIIYAILTNINNINIIEISEPEIAVIVSELWVSLYLVFLMCIFVFGIPLIISFYIGYNYDKFKYWFPKFQAFMYRFLNANHFHTFIVDDLKEPIFEIPLFKNVILTYEATDDFSKYLQRVEIREYDFQYKGEKTQWLWKAKFIFSEVPKSGKLTGKFQ